MVPRSSPAPRFSFTLLLALAALLGVSYASPSAAQSPPERDGVRVSRSDQFDYFGRAAADGSGGLLVAWARLTGPGVSEVRAQRLDRRGGPQWGDDGVAVGSMTLGQGMNLASDGAGGVFVVWYPNQEDVLVQHLDPSGVPLWGDGVPVVSGAGRTTFGNGPRVVPDGSGGTQVIWLGQKGGSPILRAAHVTADGPRVDWGPIDLAANGRQHNYHYAVSDGQGGAIVAWEDVGEWDWTQNTYEWDIRLQRLGPDGARLWGDQGRAVVAAHNQSLGEDKANPLIEDGKGGAYFSWMDNRAQYGDLYAGHITAAGVMDWGDGGIPLATLTEFGASLGLLDGDAVVVWRGLGEPNGDATFVQRVSAAGIVQWGEGGIGLAGAENAPLAPRMVADGAGGMICAWVEYGQADPLLRLQRLDAGGATQWKSATTIRGFNGPLDWMPTLVASQGGAFVVWSDVRGNGDIYAQFVNLAGHLMLPLPSDDTRPIRGAGEGGMKLAVASPSGTPLPVEFELGSDSEARLELFDVTGRRVESVRLPGGTVRGSSRLEAAALRPGVYLVVLSQNGARVAKRVVISRAE